jgi:hypothetical protein
MKIHTPNSVVSVIVLAQVWLNGCNSARNNRLDCGVLPEKSTSQMNTVDRAVDKDTTGESGIGKNNAAWV